MKMLQGLFQGANLQHAQVNVIVESGAKVVYKEVTDDGKKSGTARVTDEQVAEAIMQSQSLFWAQSAWAVVFCVCRDCLGMADNMTEFEHYVGTLPFAGNPDYDCPEGTVQKALCNNPYMRKPISKWRENGARQRALKLAENLMSALGQE